MIGMTRAEVLACAGAPLREARDGELTVMSYSNVREIDFTTYRCDVSVSLRFDRVDQVRYRGARNVCSAVIRDCRPGS